MYRNRLSPLFVYFGTFLDFENFIPVLRVCCFKNPHHLVGSSAQQDISQVI